MIATNITQVKRYIFDYNLIVKNKKGPPFLLFCNYGSLEVGTREMA